MRYSKTVTLRANYDYANLLCFKLNKSGDMICVQQFKYTHSISLLFYDIILCTAISKNIALQNSKP